MTRRLLNLLMLLSLLLCLASAALLVRSYRVSDRIEYRGAEVAEHAERVAVRRRHWTWSTGTGRARLSLSRLNWTFFRPEEAFKSRNLRRSSWSWERDRADELSDEVWGVMFFKRRGVGIDRFVETDHPRRLRVDSFYFPLWLPMALFALTPALSLRRRLKRRRLARAGHCSRCGYDLRATPGRCPECGKAPESARDF